MLVQLLLLGGLAFLMLGVSFNVLLVIITMLVMSYLYTLYTHQENILYQRRTPGLVTDPAKMPVFLRNPGDYNLAYQSLQIRTADAKMISAWFVPAHCRVVDLQAAKISTPESATSAPTPRGIGLTASNTANAAEMAYVPVINQFCMHNICEQLRASGHGRLTPAYDLISPQSPDDATPSNPTRDIDDVDDDVNDEDQTKQSQSVEHFPSGADLEQSSHLLLSSDEENDNDDADDEDVLELETPQASRLPVSTPIIDSTTSRRRQPKTSTTSSLSDSTTGISELFSHPNVTFSPESFYNPLKSTVLTQDIPTLIFCHGNAGTINHRLPFLYNIVCSQSVNVVMFDYRGYGTSTDVDPSEDGLILDIAAVYAYVVSRPDINPNLCFVVGQSLGGAVATSLVYAMEQYQQSGISGYTGVKQSKNKEQLSSSSSSSTATSPTQVVQLDTSFEHLDSLPIAIADIALKNVPTPCGLILENTFSSMSDLVTTLFPFLTPVRFLLLRMRWNTSWRLGHISKTPVLMLSSTMDEVIDRSHMQRLWSCLKHLPSELKHFVACPGAHHNDAWLHCGLLYSQELSRWLQQILHKKHAIMWHPSNETVENAMYFTHIVMSQLFNSSTGQASSPM